ncbi:MAG: phosphate acyltransferase PlsX [Chloroflexota bacterium]
MRIVVDAMGSDAYPVPDVEGAVMAAREFGDEMILVGDEPRIQAELAKHNPVGLPIHVHHASQVIEMSDKPSAAARAKKDSSMHVGMGLVRDGQADAYVTAGNTGGVYIVATLHTLGRIQGVKRPALSVIFPIANRPIVLDIGANADCKPEYLAQFGLMGAIYARLALGVANPRVALLSNGEEEGKGNELIHATIPLLAQSGLNFIGNVEPKEFVKGAADVVVTDGFTGNMLVKTSEAISSYMSNLIRQEIMTSPITQLGGKLAKPAFGRARKAMDPFEVGGAPLLGVNGVVIIAHGRSNAYAIKQAVGKARRAVEQDVVGAIRRGISDQ